MYDHTHCLGLMLFLAAAALVAAPVSIWLARRGTVARQSALLWTWLFASLFVLWWLDSYAHVLALADLREIGWFSYAFLAALLSAVFLAVGPYRDRTWPQTAWAVAALWTWSLCLPWIPWNDEKRAILDVHAVMGQPLTSVQKRLGRYEAVVYDASGTEVNEGKLAELDLTAMSKGEVQLWEIIGTLSLYVEGGALSDAYFNYD